MGAVLHTGDFRAEPWFLESLKRNPFLEKYLAAAEPPPEDNTHLVAKQLEAIFLDTACMLSTKVIPTKVSSRRRPCPFHCAHAPEGNM